MRRGLWGRPTPGPARILRGAVLAERPVALGALAAMAGVVAAALAWAWSPAAAAPPAQAGAPTITFTTQPEAGEIHVREEPAKAIVEVKDASGRPLRDVVIDLQIDTPPRGAFISTDLPRVDGTTLVKSRLAAPEGRVEMDVIWPMRGAYKVTVEASPAPGAAASFQRVSREFTLSLPERPGPATNFLVFGAILLGVGAVAGYVLGWANGLGRPA